MTRNDSVARWPLFNISPIDNRGVYRVDTKRGSRTVNNEPGSLTEKEIEAFDKSHDLLTLSTTLQNKYPNLIFSCLEKGITCWIAIKGRGREGLGEFPTVDHIKFKELNDLVDDIVKFPETYFLCSHCNKVLMWEKKCEEVFDKGVNIDRLVGTKPIYFKFQTAGASYFCEHCVENVAPVKAEYDLAQSMGSKYYD